MSMSNPSMPYPCPYPSINKKSFILLAILYPCTLYPCIQLNIQAYHGSEGGDDDGGMDGVNVAMCTMEKANSIVNRLAEERRLEVVVNVM